LSCDEPAGVVGRRYGELVTGAEGEIPGLSDLEREVMETVWNADGEISVRGVAELVNGDGGKQRAYTTFMTILSRLHAKGIVERRRQGKSDLYRPAISRQAYLEGRARTEVDALVGEYGDIALAQFARQVSEAGPDEVARLRKLAGEAGGETSRP
jgi:predicted transcriptional regulator